MLAGDEQRMRALVKLLSKEYESGTTSAGIVYFRAIDAVRLLKRFVKKRARHTGNYHAAPE